MRALMVAATLSLSLFAMAQNINVSGTVVDATDGQPIIGAGLPDDAMFTTGNMTARGYESSLDVVLDERRMELCFEGDRMFSIFRNKKTLDRRYVGYHPFTTINYDDPRIALLIPSDEILSSGIPQNDPRVNNVSTND